MSFVVRHRDAYLHHNFVVALLNDLFGIQSRGGCSLRRARTATACSASTSTTSKEFEREIVRGCEGIKPGWVRVNFNYFLSETQFEFIIDAIHLIANEGWRLLPHYRFDPDTGEWRHRRAQHGERDAARRGLVPHRQDGVPLAPRDRARVGAAGLSRRGAPHRSPASPTRSHLAPEEIVELPRTADFEELRWFPLPSEVLEELRGRPTRPPPAAATTVGARRTADRCRSSCSRTCSRSVLLPLCECAAERQRELAADVDVAELEPHAAADLERPADVGIRTCWRLFPRIVASSRSRARCRCRRRARAEKVSFGAKCFSNSTCAEDAEPVRGVTIDAPGVS